jgi:hypothetical protein
MGVGKRLRGGPERLGQGKTGTGKRESERQWVMDKTLSPLPFSPVPLFPLAPVKSKPKLIINRRKFRPSI